MPFRKENRGIPMETTIPSLIVGLECSEDGDTDFFFFLPLVLASASTLV